MLERHIPISLPNKDCQIKLSLLLPIRYLLILFPYNKVTESHRTRKLSVLCIFSPFFSHYSFRKYRYISRQSTILPNGLSFLFLNSFCFFRRFSFVFSIRRWHSLCGFQLDSSFYHILSFLCIRILRFFLVIVGCFFF